MKQSFSLSHFENEAVDSLKIGDKIFDSRLMVGTGKYKKFKRCS